MVADLATLPGAAGEPFRRRAWRPGMRGTRISRSVMMTMKQYLRRYPALGWAVVAVGGLMLALVSTFGPPEEPAAGPRAVRLVIALPDPLKVAILGLFAVAALLLLALLFPRHLRRRKKDDEAFELVYEPPKVSPWVLVVLAILILLPLALAGYFFWLEWQTFEPGVVAHTPPPGSSLRGLSSAHDAAKPFVSMPLFSWTVAVLAIVALLGCVGLMLWIFFGERLDEWWEGPVAQPRAAERLIEAIEDSLDALRREPDARRAIVMCYRYFERAVAGAGLSRAPWETPTEFMRKALGRFLLPPDAVRTLTELFQVSRFSHHQVGPGERDLAVGSLAEIKTALEQEGFRVPTT